MEEKELMLDDSMFEPLDSSEKNNEFIAVESKTYLQDAWRRFKKNKLALFGLIFLILTTLAANHHSEGFSIHLLTARIWPTATLCRTWCIYGDGQAWAAISWCASCTAHGFPSRLVLSPRF